MGEERRRVEEDERLAAGERERLLPIII